MIRCAAVQFKSKIDNQEFTLCGIRHADCYEQLHALRYIAKNFNIVEGFMNNKREFLDRHEAWDYAINCGQLSWTARIHTDCPGELYSEDLW